MQIFEKFVVIGLSTIASTAVLLTILWNQGVINNENGDIHFEKNNVPVYKEFQAWTKNIKEILKNNITKKEYKESVINKYYTLIDNNSFQAVTNNEVNKDLMLTYDKDYLFNHNIVKELVFIAQFDSFGILDDNVSSTEIPYIKGGYKYFDNNWYIDNKYLTKQTKEESIAEINKIITAVNQHAETQKQIKNSWSK